MTEHHTARPGDEGTWYRIRVQGRLDPRWESWFDGLHLSCDGDGTTLMQGEVPDEAALHGLLTKVRDLGLPLLSLEREPACGPDLP